MPHRTCTAWAAAAICLAAGTLLPALPPAAAAGVAAGKVDSAAAAKIISDYRVKHGLPPVKVETHLMKIAATHAERMATADSLNHVLGGEGSFMKRITDGGYRPMMAAENIGAGYRTLADAIIGWEQSPAHNANLLNRDVTEIGIALYSTPAGQFHAYWSLVMAHPALPPPPGTGGTVFADRPIGPFGIFGN